MTNSDKTNPMPRLVLIGLVILLIIGEVVVTKSDRKNISTYVCTLEKIGTDLAVLPDDVVCDSNYVILTIDAETKAVIYSSDLFNYIIYEHKNPVSLSIYIPKGKYAPSRGHVKFDDKVIPVYDIHIKRD